MGCPGRGHLLGGLGTVAREAHQRRIRTPGCRRLVGLLDLGFGARCARGLANSGADLRLGSRGGKLARGLRTLLGGFECALHGRQVVVAVGGRNLLAAGFLGNVAAVLEACRRLACLWLLRFGGGIGLRARRLTMGRGVTDRTLAAGHASACRHSVSLSQILSHRVLARCPKC